MKQKLSFSYEFDKTKNNEVWVSCPECGKSTAHKVLSSVTKSLNLSLILSGLVPEHSIYFTEECQIIECQGCKFISFRKTCWDSESSYGFGGEYEETEKLYPSRKSVRKMLDDKYAIPPQVLHIYEETNAALCVGHLILAGIGIRALVESVCKERGAQGNNLEKRIDDMVAKGLVTNDGAEILHSTRLMGNIAAHEVKAHSQSILEDAMDIVEHMLSAVYIIPKKAAELPKRNNRGS